MIDPAEIPLRDIHLPEPVSWWPPAPGWTVLAVAIAVLAIAAVTAWLWRRHTRVRRAAFAELLIIEARFREHGDTHTLARDLSRLTRRTALALEGASLVANATGDEWSAALDRITKTGTADPRIKDALLLAPYRPDVTIDGDALLAAFRPFIMNLRSQRTTGK